MRTIRSGSEQRAAALAFILVVISLSFTVAFILAATSTAHLGFANAVSDRMRARNLAHAAVQEALAKLQEEPTFGLNGESLNITLPGDPSNASGCLTFVATPGQPYSTNNLNGEHSVPGFTDRVVPNNSVHLVGHGRCGEVVRTVEAVVELPPFPFALASSGPIISSGELLVGSLDTQSSESADPETLLPAHLTSNDEQEDSIILGAHSVIVGDVRSTGGLELAENVVVKGEAVAFGDPVALPQIDVTRYDPAFAGVSYQKLPTYTSDLQLNGIARSSGDLYVLGNLDLNNATLYVDGTLTVQGAVVGRGMLVAVQGMEVREGARMTGNQAVLLSGADVTLSGDGAGDSFFEGFVYAEGEFVARDVTVVGSFVSQGERARVVLSNVRVLGDSSKTVWSNMDTSVRPGVQVVLGVGEGEAAGDGLASDDEEDGRFGVNGSQSDSLYLDLNSKTSLEGVGPSTRATEIGEFDLNRFLGIRDRLRVVLWQEL